jgi:hypothetical protein
VGRRPIVLLEARGDRADYREWLEAAGAKVRTARIAHGDLRAVTRSASSPWRMRS